MISNFLFTFSVFALYMILYNESVMPMIRGIYVNYTSNLFVLQRTLPQTI